MDFYILSSWSTVENIGEREQYIQDPDLYADAWFYHRDIGRIDDVSFQVLALSVFFPCALAIVKTFRTAFGGL